MDSYARQQSSRSRLARTSCADREYRAALVRLPSPKAVLAKLAVKLENQRQSGAHDAANSAVAAAWHR